MEAPDSRLATLPAWGEVGIVDIGSLTLESGVVLDDVSIAVQRWGELSTERDNVVVVLHALTGDSHITGPAGQDHPTPGWWDGVAGPGAPIDTDRWCAIATNVLGGCRGSTGPSSPAADGKPWGSRFPAITVRDQVNADLAALSALGISQVAAVVGGSMGGARALEWIVGHPDTVRAALVLAVGARATADQIGTQSTQVAAIKADPNWQNGDYHGTGRTPDAGIEIARRFAHLTYRGEAELDDRFGNDGQGEENPATGGRYAVQSYLEYQGDKLARRFDAGTYVTLTDALSSHDIGRGRGGIAAALRRVTVPVIVGGITSDRLYPLRLQEELADLLPTCTGLNVVESSYGHDGFLVETEAVYELIRQTLEFASK
ncbi:homoserine O-acetyltransferase MetX [Mycolicibacterium hodleri]|uniref:Homoserine O-acetyltransferase n=1 Tax=Mycolicibacterium hodleri TaxID=49897 RepID=A0A502EBH2_9MYCO|nr:homoserine O-acetyltransferase [Mycolicibacterium hodleri]TPG34747.1 homoserine O-acetyltransferase [Mycolicibacterium hodleri]